MKKANVITALALTVVMLVAMTGIAAADYVDVYEQGTTTPVAPLELVPGAEWTRVDLCVSNFYNSPTLGHTLTVTIFTSDGDSTDISVEFEELEATSPYSLSPRSGAPYTWHQQAAVGESETLALYIMANSGVDPEKHYSVKVEDTSIGQYYLVDAATIPASTNPIPEFTTIAVPVGAILGLLFFFNHRKRKRE